MEASQEETPQEPGNVEGPYEVDNFSWGHRTHGELKDLLNTRHHAGFDLVSHTALSGYKSSVLIWKKRND
jgi:hypothetical protein